MRVFILACLVGVAVSAPASDVDAPIVRQSSDVAADSFNYAYETGNGIVAEASGVLKPAGDYQALVVKGAFQYKADDGTPVAISYIADENGYQPQGDNLPTPHPIPDYIQRALAYIEAHPPQVAPAH